MADSHREEIARLESLYASNPGGRVFVHLAEALRKAGEPVRARSILDEGLARHPDSASGFVVQGRVLQDLGEGDAAAYAFARVLELDAGNLVALRGLADLARASGRLEDAAGHYRELTSRSPSDGEVRAALNDVERALAASQEPEPTSPAADTAVWEPPTSAAAADDLHVSQPADTRGADGESVAAADNAAAGETGDVDFAVTEFGMVDPEALPGPAHDLAVEDEVLEVEDDEAAGPAGDAEPPEELPAADLEELVWNAGDDEPDIAELLASFGTTADQPPHEFTLLQPEQEEGPGLELDPRDLDLGSLAEDFAMPAALEDVGVELPAGGHEEGVEEPGDSHGEADAHAEVAEEGARFEGQAEEFEAGGDAPEDPAVTETWGDDDVASVPDSEISVADLAGVEIDGTSHEEDSWDEPGAEPLDSVLEAHGEPAAGDEEDDLAQAMVDGLGMDPDVREGEASEPVAEDVSLEEEASPEEWSESPGALPDHMATETMAELYRGQGLFVQAAEVYRVLLRRRPGDDSLQRRLLEVESQLAGPAPAAGDEVEAAGLAEADGDEWLRDTGATWADETHAEAGPESPYGWMESSGEEGADAAEQGAAGPPIASYLQVLLGWRAADQPDEELEPDPWAVDTGTSEPAPWWMQEEEARPAEPWLSGAPDLEPVDGQAAEEEAAEEEAAEEEAAEPAEPWAPQEAAAPDAAPADEPWSVPGGEAEPWATGGSWAPEADPAVLDEAEPEPAADEPAPSDAVRRGTTDPVEAAFNEWFEGGGPGAGTTPGLAAPAGDEGPADGGAEEQEQAAVSGAMSRGEQSPGDGVAEEPADADATAGEEDAGEDDEDLAMFRSWLQSLKR
jgi:tetratricopeptide (TPR) repeat protein